jgi:hypothetical protein
MSLREQTANKLARDRLLGSKHKILIDSYGDDGSSYFAKLEGSKATIIDATHNEIILETDIRFAPIWVNLLKKNKGQKINTERPAEIFCITKLSESVHIVGAWGTRFNSITGVMENPYSSGEYMNLFDTKDQYVSGINSYLLADRLNLKHSQCYTYDQLFLRLEGKCVQIAQFYARGDILIFDTLTDDSTGGANKIGKFTRHTYDLRRGIMAKKSIIPSEYGIDRDMPDLLWMAVGLVELKNLTAYTFQYQDNNKRMDGVANVAEATFYDWGLKPIRSGKAVIKRNDQKGLSVHARNGNRRYIVIDIEDSSLI